MKKMLFAAAAMLSLGMGTAFAVDGGTTAANPQYGTHAFPNQQYHSRTVFSKIDSGLSSQRNHVQAALAYTAQNGTKPNNGH